MARSYVASRLDDPTGTGGTEFMPWLTQLRDETKDQMLEHCQSEVETRHRRAWWWCRDWPDEVDEPSSPVRGQRSPPAMRSSSAVGSAVDAVEQAVRSMEGDPVFDAGYGGYLNQDGVVQLDALLIDGSTGDFGAVAGVTKASNPVLVARFVMEQLPECFYVGEGANAVAERCGLADVVGDALVTPAMREYFDARRTDGPRDP